MKGDHVYLASPYSNKDLKIQQWNEITINKVLAQLINKGYRKIFAPIAQSVAASKAGNLPGGYDYWAETDEYFVETAKEMFITMMKGWENSYGIAKEVEHCEKSNIPLRFIRLDCFNNIETITDLIYFNNGVWSIKTGENGLSHQEVFLFKRLLDGRVR